jgi:inorganic pyrophosphatase
MSEQFERRFWEGLESLVASSEIVIDRPRGSAHPRYPALIYPLDYGYLQGPRSGDGEGINIWLGSLPERRVTAVIVTVDLFKRDAELKILLGCTPEEQRTILVFVNTNQQRGILHPRHPS